MDMGHGHKLTALFTLLIAVTLLLGTLGVFTEDFVNVVWPTFLGIIALLWMGKK
jgi:hypothetical protein